MKTPRLSPTWSLPSPSLLWALGIGLIAVALSLALLAAPFSGFPERGVLDYAWAELAVIFPIMSVSVFGSLANVALMGAVVWSASRGRSAPLGKAERFSKAFRFAHIAVLVHAVVALATLLTAMEGGLMPPELLWTSIAGAPTVLALLSGSRWDARLATLGAGVSLASLGCAIWFAPTIYGRDLQPLGWYPILATAVPVLAFLIIFLRRAPGFRRFRLLRYGLAASLFLALACAVGFWMSSNSSEDEFSENLRAALDSRPSQIMFSELTDFEWDEVEIYRAYTSFGAFSPAAREGVDILLRTSISDREIGDLAVFVKSGEVVYCELVGGKEYTLLFPPDSGNPILKPEDAVFSAEYAPGGFARLTLQAPTAPPP